MLLVAEILGDRDPIGGELSVPVGDATDSPGLTPPTGVGCAYDSRSSIRPRM
jgi:hypothetical protein